MLEVDMLQEYEKAEDPETLYSGGVGPCFVIGAIYGRKGYMLHIVPSNTEFYEELRPLFKDLKDDVKNKAHLKIYIIGGQILLSDTKGFAATQRQFLLNKIVEEGFQKAIKEVRWCEFGINQSLTLILSERRAEIEEEFCDF